MFKITWDQSIFYYLRPVIAVAFNEWNLYVNVKIIMGLCTFTYEK